MIDLSTEIAREHESTLRRQAAGAHLAAQVRCYHPAAWRAAAHRVAARVGAVRHAFRAWLAHGEIGNGYDWRSEQPGSGWQYVRPNCT